MKGGNTCPPFVVVFAVDVTESRGGDVISNSERVGAFSAAAE